MNEHFPGVQEHRLLGSAQTREPLRGLKHKNSTTCRDFRKSHQPGLGRQSGEGRKDPQFHRSIGWGERGRGRKKYPLLPVSPAQRGWAVGERQSRMKVAEICLGAQGCFQGEGSHSVGCMMEADGEHMEGC